MRIKRNFFFQQVSSPDVLTIRKNVFDEWVAVRRWLRITEKTVDERLRHHNEPFMTPQHRKLVKKIFAAVKQLHIAFLFNYKLRQCWTSQLSARSCWLTKQLLLKNCNGLPHHDLYWLPRVNRLWLIVCLSSYHAAAVKVDVLFHCIPAVTPVEVLCRKDFTVP